MQNKLATSWENKYYELQQKLDKSQKEVERLNQKFANQKQTTQKNEHSGAFWTKIRQKMSKDPDYVKKLVRSKTVTMFDTDASGFTILHCAAMRGSYEIVQFCLNQGADINVETNAGKTALDYARQKSYTHIEQLLLFATMNVTVGNQVKNISTTIHKQNGINNNMLSVLEQIGDQSKELFTKMLVELMINMINQRLAFDDVLLNLCYNIIAQENDALSSDLWRAITASCSDIVKNGNKRDWHWLKIMWFSFDYSKRNP